MTGPASTLLYAYGGFGITDPPAFSPGRLAWVEQGGVFAIAHIRGGSEYGEAWHEAGRRQNKQNVFDDFIAAVFKTASCSGTTVLTTGVASARSTVTTLWRGASLLVSRKNFVPTLPTTLH